MKYSLNFLYNVTYSGSIYFHFFSLPLTISTFYYNPFITQHKSYSPVPLMIHLLTPSTSLSQTYSVLKEKKSILPLELHIILCKITINIITF